MCDYSIEKFVDVDLWRGLLRAFRMSSKAPTWLLCSGGSGKLISAMDFYKIALHTEDERELNAISLFMWFQDFRFDLFERRCLKLLATGESKSAIQEAMLYHLNSFGEEAKSVLYNSLIREERRSYFEVVIVLLALEDANYTMKRLLLLLATSYLEKEKVNVYGDYNLLWYLAKVSHDCDCKETILFNTIYKYQQKGKIPNSRARDYGIYSFYGLELVDQLVLAWNLQKTNSGVREALLKELCRLTMDWNDDQKKIVMQVSQKVGKKKFPVVNTENLKWVIKSGLPAIFSAYSINSAVAQLCQDVQYEAVFQLLKDTIMEYGETQLAVVCEKYTSVFDILFSKFRAELAEAYKVVRKIKKYAEFEAWFLSDFASPESLDLMRELQCERDSVLYRIFMEGALSVKNSLEDEEVLAELDEYLARYYPDKLDSESNTFEEEDSEYDEY